jgi:hypothetical protein
MRLEIQKYLFDIKTSIDSINDYIGDKEILSHIKPINN